MGSLLGEKLLISIYQQVESSRHRSNEQKYRTVERQELPSYMLSPKFNVQKKVIIALVTEKAEVT